MINIALDKIEWILMVAFLLSAFNIRWISLFMAANIGLSIGLYNWFLTIPPEAAAATITLINVVTIIMIMSFGEKHIQKIIQSILLLGFIGSDALLLTDLVYESFEIILLSLYGGMLLTVSRSAGHGARSCFQIVSGSYSGRHSDNDITVPRNKKHS